MNGVAKPVATATNANISRRSCKRDQRRQDRQHEIHESGRVDRDQLIPDRRRVGRDVQDRERAAEEQLSHAQIARLGRVQSGRRANRCPEQSAAHKGSEKHADGRGDPAFVDRVAIQYQNGQNHQADPHAAQPPFGAPRMRTRRKGRRRSHPQRSDGEAPLGFPPRAFPTADQRSVPVSRGGSCGTPIRRGELPYARPLAHQLCVEARRLTPLRSQAVPRALSLSANPCCRLTPFWRNKAVTRPSDLSNRGARQSTVHRMPA